MTPKQSTVYTFIDEWWKKYGFAPSIEDIMEYTGDKSKSNVHRIVLTLCDLGHCKRVPRRARSVRPSYLKVRNVE